jgi:hypothetical protein
MSSHFIASEKLDFEEFATIYELLLFLHKYFLMTYAAIMIGLHLPLA